MHKAVYEKWHNFQVEPDMVANTFNSSIQETDAGVPGHLGLQSETLTAGEQIDVYHH